MRPKAKRGTIFTRIHPHEHLLLLAPLRPSNEQERNSEQTRSSSLSLQGRPWNPERPLDASWPLDNEQFALHFPAFCAVPSLTRAACPHPSSSWTRRMFVSPPRFLSFRFVSFWGLALPEFRRISGWESPVDARRTELVFWQTFGRARTLPPSYFGSRWTK